MVFTGLFYSKFSDYIMSLKIICYSTEKISFSNILNHLLVNFLHMAIIVVQQIYAFFKYLFLKSSSSVNESTLNFAKRHVNFYQKIIDWLTYIVLGNAAAISRALHKKVKKMIYVKFIPSAQYICKYECMYVFVFLLH